MRLAAAALVLTVLLLVPGRVLGQDLPAYVRTAVAVPGAPSACCVVARAAGATAGAVFGGALGYFVLREVGLRLARGGGDDEGLLGWILGGALGEAFGIGIGAHLGGGARGDPLAAIGGSLGLLILGGLFSYYVDLGDNAIVVVPLAQVAAAVWMELRTARD